MSSENKDLANEIDKIIRKQKWFDLSVRNYDGEKLTVVGSIDLTYYHTLEIIFEDVFFVSVFFNGWHSDTSSTVFLLSDNEIELFKHLEIEQGYLLFIFKTEDYNNDIYIAARALSYHTGTVFYYYKEDLQENERIADFVKKIEP